MRGSLLAFIAVLSACGAVKDSNNAVPDATVVVKPTLTSIAVTPTTTTLKRRLSPPQQLTAMGTYSDSTTADISKMVTWASSDMTIGLVTPGGLVSAAGATAVGDITVTATLDGKSAMASFSVLDPTVVVANYSGQRLDFFPWNAEGNVAPQRTIMGALTQLQGSWSITVHDNELYAAQANGQAINVFPVTGTGNIAPTRRIFGAATLLSAPCGVAVVADEIFVATQGGKVLVYNRTDNGDVAPKREISGALTLMSTPIALTVHNGEIFVANNGAAITVFPATATGNIAPTRRIAGPATTVSDLKGIAIRNNELFVSSTSPAQIYVFPIDANGDVPPSRIITGGMSYPSAFALLADELIIPNFTGNTVVAHNISAQVGATPIRTLSGALTGISGPMGIALY